MTGIPKIRFSEKEYAGERVVEAITELEFGEEILKQYKNYEPAKKYLYKLLNEIRRDQERM